MEKATVNYQYPNEVAMGGLMLIIPKAGNAPMLFLEWLSNFRNGKGSIHKIINNTGQLESGCFIVHLNAKREVYLSAAEYVNQNL